MPLSTERLREIVTELASRPRHEKVRSLVYALLADGLGASSTEIDFERLHRHRNRWSNVHYI